MVKSIYCNICGKLEAETKTKRLVRDHNHKTGFIRGWLCDVCNERLGMYESTNKYIHYFKKSSYWLWLRTFKLRIEYHLQCNTNVKYSYFGGSNVKELKGEVIGSISGRLPPPFIKSKC
jgi:hypothetical protein